VPGRHIAPSLCGACLREIMPRLFPFYILENDVNRLVSFAGGSIQASPLVGVLGSEPARRVWMKSTFYSNLQNISQVYPSTSIRFHPVSCDDRPYSGKLFGLLPTAPIPECLQGPHGHTPDRLIVLKAVDLALFEEFMELELSARGQWEANKIKELEAIHAVCCHIFITNLIFLIPGCTARGSL